MTRDAESVSVPRAAASAYTKCWNPTRLSGAAPGSPGPCTSSHRRTGELASTQQQPLRLHPTYREGRVSPD